MLHLWDTCEALHPLDRTLAMLRTGWPEESFDALASLPIGERERRAAALRVITFGRAAEGVHECPACGLSHEIDPPFGAILESSPVDPEPSPLSTGGYDLILRVLDSRDQAAITHSTDALEARAQLLRLCVLAASRAGEPVEPSALSGEVVTAIAETLAERDSHAETLITLTCAGCDRPWTIVFDAGEFLWREVAMHARRLLREIDHLARVYHWSEAEVLSLSAKRRQAYLDMVVA